MSVGSSYKGRPDGVPTKCWHCRYGTVVVEMQRRNEEDDLLELTVRREVAFCRNPRIAGSGDPLAMDYEVSECQGFISEGVSVAGEEPPRQGPRKRRKRRRGPEDGSK